LDYCRLSYAFVATPYPLFSHTGRKRLQSRAAATSDSCSNDDYDFDIASQFEIVTCSASICAKQRSVLGIDEFATFSAFYERTQTNIPEIAVSESSCLGACENAPCVAVYHAEYEGSVALQGMDTAEFADRVFHRIVDEDDVDRVWNCITNAIAILADEQEQTPSSFLSELDISERSI
jgi:(2Fe-2S) ferredoxin